MLLKEVNINGFKSFADRTHVSMRSGVTAVVGPNGCGKSNIVDAIRWVLGEQSAKALRGNKMQDVIFDGTERRKPLQLCEVSLVFTDCEKELGTAFNEVEITRRVSRDGGSDYYLNGKACRLRDIHQLFMDTGIGRESYSFMAQGQITQIVEANPAQRRSLFEEAAGITKYKAQRKEALGKLELVEQNLSRVSDVIEEVSRQIGSLKRQASKTLRFKRLKHRLTHLDLAWNSYRYAERNTRVVQTDEEAGGLRGKVTAQREHLSTKETRLNTDRQQRSEIFAKIQEIQQRVFDLRSEKENAENHASFAASRKQDTEERIEKIRQEISHLQQSLKELTDKADTDIKTKEEQLNLVGSSDQVFKEKNLELDSAQKALDEAERTLRDNKQKLLVVESGITRLRSNSTSLEVDMKTLEAKHHSIHENILQFKEEHDTTQAKLQETQQAAERRQNDREKANAAVSEAQEHVAQLQTAYRDLQGKIQEQNRTVTKLTAQLNILEGLQAKFEGFSDGAKALLQGKLEDLIPAKSLKPITRQLVVDEAWTQAAETLLGSATDALILQEKEKLPAIAATLRDKALGRACLQIDVPTTASEPGITLPDFIRPASEVIKAKKDTHAALVQNLVNGCYVCDTLENFLTFWYENLNFNFTLIVTNECEIIDRRGLVFGGFRRKQGKESSLIQRENEIRRLKTEAEKENDLLTEQNEQAMQAQVELDEAEKTVEERRARVVEIGQELSSIETELRNLRDSQRRNEENLNRAERDLNEADQRKADAKQRLQTAGKELEEAEQRITDLRKTLDEGESSVERLRTERDAKREAVNDVHYELAEKKQQLEIINRGIQSIEQQKRDLNDRLIRRQQDIDEATTEIASYTDNETENRQRAEEVQKTLEITTGSLQGDQKQLEEIDSRIRSAEKEISSERELWQEDERRLNKLDIELAKDRSQLEFISQKVATEYEMDIAEVDWKQQLWKADEKFETRINLDELDEDGEIETKSKRKNEEPTEEDLAAMDSTDWKPIEQEIEQLRKRIAAIGEVNLVAIEEYAELRERYNFLKTQSDDLWQSKEELVKAIDEINATSQQMFQETFEQVRKNFQHTYKRLNGGFADLRLGDEEDILEAGIEIVAQPLGTKLKTLSLLSGGQKTMVAVALLFAIYMVKPSPFCVLDELDAPLDDANIGRFCEMLESFLEFSQFLVITHNKRTLHVASTIYGVTMQEPGVTKLVSMKFDRSTGQTVEFEKAPATEPEEAEASTPA